jgi:alkaline phosphatase D
LKSSLFAGAATWAATPYRLETLIINGRPVPTLVGGGLRSPRPEQFRVVSAANPEGTFPQSVASGDPQASSIVLWTRVNPSVFGSAEIAWQISTTPDFASILVQGTLPVSAMADYTVKAVLNDLPQLQPATTHYYRFVYGGQASKTGRFKTFPSANASPSRARFAYLSCQDYTNGYYNALKELANEDLDFVVHLGDYLYESTGDPALQGNQVRPIGTLPSGGTVADTLNDYRFLYKIYRSDADLQRVHEQFAFICIWDDHEFQNDSFQDRHPDNTPTPGSPETQLRLDANQAWAEYIPSAAQYINGAPVLQSLQIYRSFRFGQLLELVMTDERLYREGPPCGFDSASRYGTTGCEAQRDASRTMFGSTQKNWFINKITGSDAVWKVWGNEMMCMPLKLSNQPGSTNDVYLTLDAWDGYPAERTSILNTFAQAGIRNLVAITGDIHSYGAGFLQTDFEATNPVNVGVEFVGGSVTSSNFVETLQSAVSSPSMPVPRETLIKAGGGGIIGVIARIMNPHLRFFNSNTHGYVVVDADDRRLQATMYSVSTVTEPSATKSVLKQFTVPRNRVQIQES